MLLPRIALVMVALWALPASAQEQPAEAPPPTESQASEAADKFALDLPAADAEADAAVTGGETPDAEASDARVSEPVAPSPDAVVTGEADTTATEAEFTIDTPIETLLANFRSKAVLDKRLPGLSTDKNLAKFKKLSLRKLQPASGGRLTEELLEQTGKDLEAIK